MNGSVHPGPDGGAVSKDHLAWFRLRRSGLVDPFDSAVQAAHRLGGIQAQVLRSAGLSLSVRLAGPFTQSDLARVLYDERRLVKLWGHRRTLHLYVPEDWPKVFTLFRDRKTWAEMATRKIGGDLNQLRAGVEHAAARLQEVDTLSKKMLLEERPDLAPFLNLGIGLFMDLVQMGAACHVRPVGSESYFAARESWLPELEWEPPHRGDAGAAFARRCLEAYGPATVQDVAFWLGEKVSDARMWLGSLGDDVATVNVDGRLYSLVATDADALGVDPPSRSEWPVRLLHRYDALVLAHKDKSWLIKDARYKDVWKAAGVVEAGVLVNGRIAGVWKYELKTRTVRIVVTPFGRLPARARKQIKAEAQRVADHLELELSAIDYT